MTETYYSKAGTRVPSLKEAKYVVRLLTTDTYEILARRNNNLRRVMVGGEVKANNHFRTLTGVGFLPDPITYFGAHGTEVDSEAKAVYYLQGTHTYYRESDVTFRRANMNAGVSMYYYKDSRPCSRNAADTSIAVLPTGLIIKCNTDGSYSSVIQSSRSRQYLDANGNTVHAPQARYRLLFQPSTGLMEVCKKVKGCWTSIGAIPNIYPFAEIVAIDEDAAKPSHTSTKSERPIVQEIWGLCKNTTWIKREHLSAYLVLLLHRNIVRKNGPIINTRLWDSFGQPIYIADTGYNPDKKDGWFDLNKVKLVTTISEAKSYANKLQYLPAPLQWCDDVRDMVWNPGIPVAPVNATNLKHICGDRSSRLPPALAQLSPDALLTTLKDSLQESARIASCDIHYALPFYSMDYSHVNLYLPLKVPALYGDEIVAAAVMTRTKGAYQLCTVVTLDMVEQGVAAFTNPANTWAHKPSVK